MYHIQLLPKRTVRTRGPGRPAHLNAVWWAGKGSRGRRTRPRWALEALICAAPVEIRPDIDFERDSPEGAWLFSVTLGLALGHGAIK